MTSTNTGPAFSTPEPERVGPFELERLLGRGGMAETFVAIKRGPAGFEQRVCLKRILPVLANDPNMVRMFLDEARNTASLRHSNIVQVIDFGTDGGNHYLALELVDGIDLQRLMEKLPAQQRGLSAELVTHIAIELSAALDHAHNAANLAGQRGVFHRDISPSNVLLSDNGDLKLTDFGVAKAAGQARSTAAGIVRGKVEYMAPEYGMGGEYDARCDQYSLGVLLFEILTGVRPYVGNSQGEVLHRARQGFHRPLSTLRSDVPAVLSETIGRMIRPRGEQRFGSMAEVTAALLDIAPGPRGRVALGQLVTRARSGAIEAEPSVDALGSTMVLPAVGDALSPPSSSVPPISSSALVTSTTQSVARLTQRSNRRIAFTFAIGAGVLLLIAWLMRSGEQPTPPRVEGSTPSQAAQQAGKQTSPQIDLNAHDEAPLPIGLEPPLDPLEARDPNEAQSGASSNANNGAARSPRNTNQATRPDDRTPAELIHRQKHDLIQPKDW